MTDKEALARLETCSDCCNDCVICKDRDAALEIALSALRERIECGGGCLVCGGAKFKARYTMSANGLKSKGVAKFCPSCGHKLSPNAEKEK